MPLQDISPINDQLADIIVRADEPWIESSAGQAWMKVLWVGPETGRWAALFRWKKGYIASPHKHLSDAHTYVLKGQLKVRDGVLNAGDYDYEPNGVLHGETEALEDTEYLFICDGPVLFFTMTPLLMADWPVRLSAVVMTACFRFKQLATTPVLGWRVP